MNKELPKENPIEDAQEAKRASFFEEDVKPTREFKNSHIIQIEQFDPANLEILFTEAGRMKELIEKKKRSNLLHDFGLATLFYEASTRTRLSLERAMHNLGGYVITESNVQFSSRIKGEILEDTIRIVNNYSDVIALRHEEEGAAKVAAKYSDVPVINAGDGKGQHPTQTFLDLFTTEMEIGRLSDFKITMMGDLKYGRTVHSLVYSLALYPKVRMHFISPQFLELPEGIKQFLEKRKVSFSQSDCLDNSAYTSDVIYVTRAQKERMKDSNLLEEYECVKDIYKLPVDFPLNSKAVILHPFPRNEEIPQEIDQYPQAAYFRQSANGVPIRMALLKMVLLGN